MCRDTITTLPDLWHFVQPSGKVLDELPSYVALKSVQGPNQAREDIRQQVHRQRRGAMASIKSKFSYNKVSPEGQSMRVSVAARCFSWSMFAEDQLICCIPTSM